MKSERWCVALKSEYSDGGRLREKGFISGVLLLSLSTMIVKIIGLAFKIPMLSYLGTEGMGYFNSAYEIYALLCIISTSGLPVALSILISAARTQGDWDRIKRIYKVARGLFAFLGLGGSALMLLFCRSIAVSIGNPDSYLCIAAISPALFFICMASAVRGYCQGFEDMAPTAISQLIEAIFKLLLGILFAVLAIKKRMPVPAVAAFSVLGVTVGTLLSAAYLALQRTRRKFRRSLDASARTVRGSRVLRPLLAIALPITLGSALLGVTRIVDMTLIMHRLQSIGLTVFEANSIYGAYTTLALPVFSLVPALITPVSMALVPQLSSFVEEKNEIGQRTVSENSMRLTVLFAMPASLGLVAFATPILEILFKGQDGAIAIAAPMLSVLGTSVLFSCIITTTNAILQAQGHAKLPIVSMLVGVFVKITASYFLIGVPEIGEMGAPVGSLLCNISVTVINLYFMGRQRIGELDFIKVFIKPLVASAISVGAAFALYVFTAEKFDTVYLPFTLSLGTAVLSYFAFCRLTKGITEDDIALLPFGERISRIIKNKRLTDVGDGGKNDGSGKKENAS